MAPIVIFDVVVVLPPVSAVSVLLLLLLPVSLLLLHPMMPAVNKAATANMISFLNFMILYPLVALRPLIIKKESQCFALPGEPA
jgi:hypothetical protein